MVLKISGGTVVSKRKKELSDVYIKDGKIIAVTLDKLPFDKEIDAAGLFVAPGFIDMHVHGGGGYDFIDEEDGAVEKAVDLATEEIKSFAKISKDAAAGAVLISAIGAVAVGISILWQPEAFSAMAEYYKENIPVLIGFIISFIASLVFVFAGPIGIKNFFKNHVK